MKKCEPKKIKKEKVIKGIIEVIEGDMARCGGSGSGSGATSVAGVRG